MKPVNFHPSAEIEMNEAAKYYELKVPDLGKRFLNEVQNTIRRISIVCVVDPSLPDCVTIDFLP